MITQTYYISSGRLDAMYTLRMSRTGDSQTMYPVDNYLCNLSTNPEKAEAKARDYFDRISTRISENEGFKLEFAGYADFELFSRRAKLSVFDTEKMETLESGVMPFGKHEGTRLEDLPMNTVLWFADKSNDEFNKPVFQAVCDACMGLAMEKGYIAAREKAAIERAEVDARSQHIGAEKQRMDFEGTLVAVIDLGEKQVAYNAWVVTYMNKIRCGDNIVVYYGKPLGEAGTEISMKATVKAHNEYNGVKQTIVNRPSVK